MIISPVKIAIASSGGNKDFLCRTQQLDFWIFHYIDYE